MPIKKLHRETARFSLLLYPSGQPSALNVADTAGGTTSTKISYSNESNPYQQNKKSADAAALIGQNLDVAV